MSINRGMDKDIVPRYNGLLFSHKKVKHSTICRNMAGLSYWDVNKRKTNIQMFINAYIWNLEKWYEWVKVAQLCPTFCDPIYSLQDCKESDTTVASEHTLTIQSMGFSTSESWSGQPFPSPGDLPNPGIEPRSPTLPLEKEMATPTLLAWRIPGMGEPGGLPSTGSHRVGHGWSDLAAAAAAPALQADSLPAEPQGKPRKMVYMTLNAKQR